MCTEAPHSTGGEGAYPMSDNVRAGGRFYGLQISSSLSRLAVGERSRPSRQVRFEVRAGADSAFSPSRRPSQADHGGWDQEASHDGKRVRVNAVLN